jgi:hypothetical protein
MTIGFCCFTLQKILRPKKPHAERKVQIKIKSIEGLATHRFDMSGICASKEYAKHKNANSCTSSSIFQLRAKRFMPDCDKI